MVMKSNYCNSMNILRNWKGHQSALSTAMERLTTGLRINHAKDDPSGMAMSQRMKMQLRMLKQQQDNVADAADIVDTADSAMSEVQSMLQRMNELAVKASSGTWDENDRYAMNAEYQQLVEEIDRIGSSTSYNSISLFKKDNGLQTQDSEETTVIHGSNLDAFLDGLDSFIKEISIAAKDGDSLKLDCYNISSPADSEGFRNAVIEFTKKNGEKLLNQEGTTDGNEFTIAISGGNITVHLDEVSSNRLGLKGTDLLSQGNAGEALDAVKSALERTSRQRGGFGAMQERLLHTQNVLSAMELNLEEACSRITDADMAKEMMNYTKEQLLSQVSGFLMAQVNRQQPNIVLALLQS